jgi:formylglycine-generating enzyme required for sulfatase activity
MSGEAACCVPGRRNDDTRIQVADPRPAVTSDQGASVVVAGQLVALPGGWFAMGSEDADVNPGDGEGPIRRVHAPAFSMAPTTVTNVQFVAFIEETGYLTTAEREGWSYVFAGFVVDKLSPFVRGRAAGTPWWLGVDGADWRHPEGPGSDITRRPHYPVVHVSHFDAQAYCGWAGVRLPREYEWEYAARGGLVGQRFPWGNEREPRGRYRCNIWRGRFPVVNTADDGWRGACPVTEFPPNGYGLYNMVGNVWEWTADRWSAGDTDRYAMRGGSYLCHDSYCNRYRVAARTSNAGDATAGNLGFRVCS